MSKSRLETLTLLKRELDFLERGGYGGILPWRPVAMFLDSPSCPNRLDADRATPCPECFLYSFVPENYRQEHPPCHFIPLNRQGESIYTMSRQYSMAEVEGALRAWLHGEIRRLESAEHRPEGGTGAH